jgi:hypothetical protein
LLVKPLKNKKLIPRFLEYWHGAQRFAWPQQPWYTGTGLHYNPTSTVLPRESQVCGINRHLPEYNDTLSYNMPVDTSLISDFGPLQMVRCKITQMENVTLDSVLNQNGWHRDESPYEVLRVVIPLQSDYTYQFQLDNSAPEALIPGYAYAFDQKRYHRVFSHEPSDIPRIHLVLSFVGWFDLTDDGWKPNAFFNTAHPLDLFDLIDV